MNATSCHAFLKQQQPDAILMDVNLPDVRGIELCKEVRHLFSSVFVPGLSTFNQRPVIQNMIDNGASGYILKNATKEELLEAIGTVMKGKRFLSFDAALSMKDPDDKPPLITRREKEILQLIAEGLTNAEVGEKLFISIATVNTHRKSLLEKFDAKNTAALISKASKSGIL